MLTLNNINKQYRDFSLTIADLKIDAGSYFMLLGPTGSGTTLLMNIIAGLISPDAGALLYNDSDITRIPPERRGFGVVYQDSALFPHLDVEGNIGFGLKVQGCKKEEIHDRVSYIMARLGIGYLSGRSIDGLSGGEQQRIAIARALIIEPKLLLFDEPFSSLDYMTKEDMIGLTRQIRKEYNPTILHITHNFEEAMALADMVGVIKDGSIIQTGTVQEVFRQPEDIFVANFVGAKNIFKGKISGSGTETTFETENNLKFFIGREINSEFKNAVIGADEIILSRTESKSSATNVFRGRVITIINKRGINEVSLDIGSLMHIYITSRSLNEMEIKKGDELYCIFKGSSIHLF